MIQWFVKFFTYIIGTLEAKAKASSKAAKELMCMEKVQI